MNPTRMLDLWGRRQGASMAPGAIYRVMGHMRGPAQTLPLCMCNATCCMRPSSTRGYQHSPSTRTHRAPVGHQEGQLETNN